MLISGSNFARLAGVARQNIYNLIRNKKLVKTPGDMYDTDDHINKEYLLNRGLTLDQINDFLISLSASSTENTPKEEPKSIKIPVIKKIELPKIETHKSKKPEQKFEELDDISGDVFQSMTGLPAKMMRMTMKSLVMKYGGPMQLKSWADILGKIMQSMERDQKIQERDLELIEKDFVASRLFSYLENLSNLLLDFPESCVDRIIAMLSSQKENVRSEITEDMRNELGILIKNTKSNIDRELENLMEKYDKEKEDDE